MAGESEHSIEALIWQLIRRRLKNAVRLGKAVNIDMNKGVCDVQLDDKGDLMLHDVKLKAVESGAGVGQIIEPQKDSYVLAAMIDGLESSWTLIQYTEIENWSVFCEKAKIELFNSNGGDEVHLNGKSKGGLAIVSELVKKYNAIEKDLNNLKTALQPVLTTPVNEAGNGAPSAFQSALNGAISSWYGQQLTETQATDIENDKVKHGNN